MLEIATTCLQRLQSKTQSKTIRNARNRFVCDRKTKFVWKQRVKRDETGRERHGNRKKKTKNVKNCKNVGGKFSDTSFATKQTKFNVKTPRQTIETQY